MDIQSDSSPQYPSRKPNGWIIAGFLLATFALCELGLWTQIAGHEVTPVWPASGVGLAFFLLYGLRLWPLYGVTFLLALLTYPGAFWLDVSFTLANLLETAVLAWSLRRLHGFDPRLASLTDILRLFLHAALTGAAAALLAVMSMLAAHMIPLTAALTVGRMWWASGMIGILTIAPLLLWGSRRFYGRWRITLEEILLYAAALVVAGFVFALSRHGQNVMYFVFPVVIWAALRLGLTATAGVNAIFCLVAAGSISVHSPLSGHTGAGLFDIQGFLLISVLSGLLLTVTTSVHKRTLSRLRRELAERERTARALAESQARDQLMAEVAEEGMLIYDADGWVTFANRKMKQLAGLADHEQFNCRFAELMQEADRAFVTEHLERRRQGISERYDICLHRRDGRQHWVMVAASPIHDREGNYCGGMAMMTDIDERKRSEEAMTRMAAILEATSDFVGSARLNGEVIYRNAAMRSLAKNQADPHIPDLHPEWAIKRVREEAIPTALAEGRWVGESALNHPDGYEIPVSQVILAIRNDEGEVEYLATICRDIRDRIAAEAKLRQQQELLSAVIDALPLNVFMRNADSAYLRVNQYAAAFRGPGQPLVPGMSIYDVFGEKATFVRQKDLLAWESGELVNYEIEVPAPQGGCRALLAGQKRLEVAGMPPMLVGYSIDITPRKKVEQALRESEQRFRSVFENAPVGLGKMTLQGDWQQVNAALCELTGYTAAELMATNVARVTHADDRAMLEQTLLQLQRGEEECFRAEQRYIRKDGSIAWAKTVQTLVRAEDGRPLHILVMAEDTSATRQARLAQQRLATILEATPDFVAFTDPAGRCLFINAAGKRMLGLEETSVSALNLLTLCPAWARATLTQNALPAAAQEGAWQGEIALLHRDGHEIPVSQVIQAHRSPDGQVDYLSTIARDISERKLHEQALERQASHDPLTGLPNRHLLQKHLSRSLREAGLREQSVAALFIDLDYFKVINDSLGHQIGDHLLQAVARRLQAAAPGADTVARLGGDEFVAIFTDMGQEEAAAAAAERILEAMGQPFQIDGHELFVSCSIGIAMAPRDGRDFETVIRHADLAMYRCKEQKRNAMCFFAPEMNRRAQERLALENNMRIALEHGEFRLVYQPIADVQTGQICGVEALMRWQSPQLGIVSPTEFIPVAEQIGLIGRMGEWALRTACHQNRQWQLAGLPPISIAVNLSARQLLDPGLVDMVARTLDETGLASRYLELELTETAFMENREIAMTALHALRELGVSLSIDDFGTGYSSLAYLKTLPVDTLKLDRTFVQGITTEPNDAAIAASMITMARTMQLNIIAEGVETQGQLDYLRRHYCSRIQGYFFMPPVESDVMRQLLQDGRSLPNPDVDIDKRPILLIVDDEPNVASALKRVLRAADYQILTASSAHEAFELLARHEVAVIISDQRMPQMNGTEFLSRVKSMYPKTIRIVVSGFSELGAMTDAINHGAVYKFLTKPWDNEQMRANIRDAFIAYEQQQIKQAG